MLKIKDICVGTHLKWDVEDAYHRGVFTVTEIGLKSNRVGIKYLNTGIESYHSAEFLGTDAHICEEYLNPAVYNKFRHDLDNDPAPEMFHIADNKKDEYHGKRQDNKKEVGPAVLMEIFGKACEVGVKKGYMKNGWWLTKPRYTHTNLMTSLKRHLIEAENGKKGSGYGYKEHHPKTGEEIDANHAYAIFWNAAMLAMSVYFGNDDEDDRWLQ